MTEEFKKAYEEYTHDEDGSLSLPCCIDEYEGFARHFYNLALDEVKKEMNSRVKNAKEFAERARGAKDDFTACTWDYTAESYKSLIQFIDNKKQ